MATLPVMDIVTFPVIIMGQDIVTSPAIMVITVTVTARKIITAMDTVTDTSIFLILIVYFPRQNKVTYIK